MGSSTKEDIAYLNSKCLRSPPVDPTFPFLFYKRKDVDTHNQKILSTLPGELLIINAVDEHDNTVPIEQLYKHSANLANQIMLKEDILIEIYGGNYDIKDSLINGSDGQFKSYTQTSDVDVIWVEFNNQHIGRSQNTKLPQPN